MFTERDKKIVRWRSDKRKLNRMRNKVKRLEKKLKDKKYNEADLPQLRNDIVDAKVTVSTLELRVGDKPE